MKVCTKCGESKDLFCFSKTKRNKDGFQNWCKVCTKVYKSSYYRANKQSINRKSREYYIENKEQMKSTHQDWVAKNSDKVKAIHKRYRERNKESVDSRIKNWVAENKERRRKTARDWHRNKLHSDSDYKIACRLRTMLWRTLKCAIAEKVGTSEESIGYTSQHLKAHLESRFLEGMNWDNYGEWHIDHIIPVKEMIDLGITDPAKINALDNLAPRWAKENMAKGANFELSMVYSSPG